MNTGEPMFFNLDVYFALIDMYISADEVERALWLLDNPPAYYRDKPPQRLRETREALHRQLWTPAQYRGIYEGATNDEQWPHRAEVLESQINKQKDRPTHIMELAPGSLWLKESLQKRGHEFTYEYISLDKSELVSTVDPMARTFFVAFEIIEHLANTKEIYQNYLKFGKRADVVVVSTPLYTFSGGLPDWRERPLGHLRAYTPRELHEELNKMFEGFNWHCHVSDTITMVGERA